MSGLKAKAGSKPAIPVRLSALELFSRKIDLPAFTQENITMDKQLGNSIRFLKKNKERLRKSRRDLRQKLVLIRKPQKLKQESEGVGAELAHIRYEQPERKHESEKLKKDSKELRTQLAHIKSGVKKREQQQKTGKTRKRTFKKTNSLKFDYFIDLIIRYRWLLLISFCLAMIGGMFVSVTTPRIYEANTLILVEPKSIPDKYVEPLTEVTVKERVSTITQQIKSRTYIERVINGAELFAGPEYENMLSEEKVAAVRGNMKVKVTRGRRGADSFTISFRGNDPEKITRAVNILAGYFIDESIRFMAEQVFAASDFIQEELRDKAEDLIAVENALREYRTRYMGGLSEQLDSNLKMLDIFYTRLNEREKGLRDEKRRLIQLGKQANTHKEIKDQYEDTQKSIKQYEEDISEILNKISRFEKRIEDTPKREQELMSLTRDYKNLQDSYNKLLSKKLDADMAVRIERKSIGQRFRILDSAKVSEKPVSPDIKKLFIISVLTGLGIGIGLMLLLDILDTSEKT
ncbi:GumC family protein [Desulfonema magnum]|uniref:Polysaccharide chain length determinant protein domain-containing protein n=1 Tax=Desulfonema magnum TaxID=45655 RepID=A0A975BSP8_9BACT|nr:GNVR domain-containing protein [Desulfonema magnum]QTA90737.1 Polysaccharide chain length determinant protein domain-containing protein [Desulfonema magnum]